MISLNDLASESGSTDLAALCLGLDIGSTTVKVVIFDPRTQKILSCRYRRHYSDVFQSLDSLVAESLREFPERLFHVAITGSAGIGISQKLQLPFVQEVVACAEAVMQFIPQTDVVIELGGEDAKITFFEGSIDQRMNETCAGGTGAFIDQIAVTLKTDASGLNELAARHKKIHPIAARCGVFTKSDVTMLLNEGAAREDLAASVLQAVVDQTIGGLACGRKIRGNVAFLGGPLHFLPELRKRFVETLKLSPQQEIVPEKAHYFVALGAALSVGIGDWGLGIGDCDFDSNSKRLLFSVNELKNRFDAVSRLKLTEETNRLTPLFASQVEFDEFQHRHDQLKSAYADISEAKGDVFLGIDAGSTTTKAVLLDGQSRILRLWYGPNEGEPIRTVLRILDEIYEELPPEATLRNSCVTGYGEYLLKAALGIDDGEVETLAHYRAARFFVPNVSFILDIGGQDIKCIYIKDGHLDKIILNEACSSGCGSFIETFAKSLGYDVANFAKEGLFAAQPIDLGTRCTVFMNSKVKQAQKENATVADISAGISYSVAKNALYKVLKISDANELGSHVVVQGGTFCNSAVLRAFERLISRNVYRTDISGLMGAFGAALIASDRAGKTRISSIISQEGVKNFAMSTTQTRCTRCSNKCNLGIHVFSSDENHGENHDVNHRINHGAKTKKFVSGNKCERGIGKQGAAEKVNLFRYQYERLFDYYEPLNSELAPRGEIGIPRVLNMYENFPFWVTLFQEIGFRVVLSDPSNRRFYDKGLDSITSQTLCYPAKMVHGHIANLIEKGVKRIFYPALPLERKEFHDAVYSYNCPVVGSYPELIRLNVDEIKAKGIDYIQPFLPGDDPKKLAALLYKEFKRFGVKRRQIRKAVEKASAAQLDYKHDVRKKGEETVVALQKSGEPGIVLAGRPYHLDPLIHHGIPDLIVASGAAVLSGDSVAHLGEKLLFPLLAVDQWGYHARLYRAATFAATHRNIQMVQLTSFGCGLDAVTAEQVAEILASVGKVHTLLKIDEGTQLGAVKIRIRSLLSMNQAGGRRPEAGEDTAAPLVFPNISRKEVGTPMY